TIPSTTFQATVATSSNSPRRKSCARSFPVLEPINPGAASSVIRLVKRLPRRPLRCAPRRRLPARARRARRRVLHAGRVEGRPPAALVVLGQLEVEALAVHPGSDAPDTGPGIEPGAKRRESPVM